MSFWSRSLIVGAFLEFLVVGLAYGITAPTSGALMSHFISDRRLSGLLIGMYFFMAALLQPVQTLIIKYSSLRTGMAILMGFVIVGNVVYTLSPPTNSLVLLFVGRGIAGLAGSAQFATSVVTRVVPENELLVVNVLFNTWSFFVLMLANLISALISGTTASIDESRDLNETNIPSIVAIGVAVVVLIISTCTLSTIEAAKEAGNKRVTPHDIASCIVGFGTLAIVCYGEGTRQIVTYELCTLKWEYNISETALIAAAILFGCSVLQLVTLRILKLPQVVQLAIVIPLWFASTMIVAPWDLPKTTGIPLFVVVSPLFSYANGYIGALGSVRIQNLAKKSNIPNVIFTLVGIVYCISLGIGNTFATLFPLSVYPFVVLLILQILSTVSSFMVPM